MGSGGSFLDENTPLSETQPIDREEKWRIEEGKRTLTLLEEGEGGEEEERQEHSGLLKVS